MVCLEFIKRLDYRSMSLGLCLVYGRNKSFCSIFRFDNVKMCGLTKNMDRGYIEDVYKRQTTSAEAFLNWNTIKIVILGLVAFAVGTAAGVLFGKLMCIATHGRCV